MTLILLLRTIVSIRATLLLATSPLFLGLWIIFIALNISIFLALTYTTWLGIMLFLIYVGGLLVMFAYFVALTPNLVIEGNTILSLATITNICLLSTISFIALRDIKHFSKVFQLPIRSLIAENIFAILIIALVLFFALVAVVKLCSNFSAPLRPFNNYVNPTTQNTPAS